MCVCLLFISVVVDVEGCTSSYPMVTLHQTIAITLFLWSSRHQYKCHRILALLRTRPRTHDKTATSTLYAIPKGDWFQLTSSPHYLAEVLVYASLCLLMEFSNLYCCLALATTLLNLLYTSRLNQRWYIRTFKDYPTSRWTLIPFVF